MRFFLSQQHFPFIRPVLGLYNFCTCSNFTFARWSDGFCTVSSCLDGGKKKKVIFGCLLSNAEKAKRMTRDTGAEKKENRWMVDEFPLGVQRRSKKGQQKDENVIGNCVLWIAIVRTRKGEFTSRTIVELLESAFFKSQLSDAGRERNLNKFKEVNFED